MHTGRGEGDRGTRIPALSKIMDYRGVYGVSLGGLLRFVFSKSQKATDEWGHNISRTQCEGLITPCLPLVLQGFTPGIRLGGIGHRLVNGASSRPKRDMSKSNARGNTTRSDCYRSAGQVDSPAEVVVAEVFRIYDNRLLLAEGD